jgi:hypothetical protein
VQAQLLPHPIGTLRGQGTPTLGPDCCIEAYRESRNPDYTPDDSTNLSAIGVCITEACGECCHVSPKLRGLQAIVHAKHMKMIAFGIEGVSDIKPSPFDMWGGIVINYG